MNYRHLPMRCECGEIPDHINEVGFSDDHQLVIHWWCSRCKRLVSLSKPLAECWRDCPSPEESLEARLESMAGPAEPAFSDLEFLRSVGVRPC
jgi:hypothetical protein